MGIPVGWMGILDSVRRHLSELAQVEARSPVGIDDYVQRPNNSRSLREVGKLDKQRPVALGEDYLADLMGVACAPVNRQHCAAFGRKEGDARLGDSKSRMVE